MLNFTYTDGKLAKVSSDYAREAINRNDMKTMADAERIAGDATALTGTLHVAADRGTSTYPHFDVIEAPVVGTEVSREFNGDAYPAGKIISVSKSLRRVETENGTVFYRVGQSGSWRAKGTWYMTPGSVSKYNPSF